MRALLRLAIGSLVEKSHREHASDVLKESKQEHPSFVHLLR